MTEYDIYLVPTRNREDRNQEAEDRPIVSPVSGQQIDFYDSGVWLTRENGRNFFPYEQIRTITEHTGEGQDRREESSSEA